jgi:predicted phosphodiesterase
MTTIGLLSDIHGNATALEAVLRDAASEHVDEFWCLGDVIMPGPGLPRIMQLLDEAGTTLFVRGNWDDCIAEVCAGQVNLDDHSDISATVLVAWLLDRMPSARELVDTWPMTASRTINGVHVRAQHNLVDRNHGDAPLASAPGSELLELCGDADIVVFGHCHAQTIRWADNAEQWTTHHRPMIVNPGSVGNAFPSPGVRDVPAEYALLHIEEDARPHVDFRCLPYDQEAELATARRLGMPYLDFYRRTLTADGLPVYDQDFLAAIEAREGYRQVAEAFLAGLK